MGELLDSLEPMKPLRRGDVVEGVVMRVDSEGIVVNIGHKAEGVVPSREMRGLSAEEVGRLRVGDEILTLVLRAETAEGSALLSIDKAASEKGWRKLEKLVESGGTIDGAVTGFNRGGVIVDVEGVSGFIPMSQLVSISRDRLRDVQSGPEQERTEQGEAATADGQGTASPPPTEEIGSILRLKVLEVNRSRNRAIFSERQAMREQRDVQKARLIGELREGEVRRGRVTGISSFGAFVDLGGADGLIHISELSWSPVSSPQEVVKVGDELDVYVLRIDAENKKIALSLRRLHPEPWATLEERFQVGDTVDATITKLAEFGAFARIEDSIEGLIHISELTDQRISHPREVVREGDKVKLKILRIEADRRRLGLSLKQAEEDLDAEP